MSTVFVVLGRFSGELHTTIVGVFNDLSKGKETVRASFCYDRYTAEEWTVDTNELVKVHNFSGGVQEQEACCA